MKPGCQFNGGAITSTILTWLRPPRPSHGLRCEIVWIYLVFCVLYVNQSLLIAEIYQHSITSTTLTCLRPPRPSHGLRCEIVRIYFLVFCVAVCKSVLTDCRDISTLYYTNHLDMAVTPKWTARVRIRKISSWLLRSCKKWSNANSQMFSAYQLKSLLLYFLQMIGQTA